MLTEHSQQTLARRRAKGNELILQAWHPASVEADEDFESAAKDAISDILTALFGPAGTYKDVRGEDGRLERVTNADVYSDAKVLLDNALDSYYGDAEDYIEADEPDSPAVAAIKAAIEAKTIERTRIFLYAGGEHDDAFDISDEEAVARFQALDDEASDRIYENFKGDDYEALDEVNGVLGGLALALRLVEESS